jgi:hypothetical protein
MRKAITFIVIFNLLFSIMGVAQYAHYCCDTMSQAFFAPPSCDCDEDACAEEEGSDCCKNEVKVVQLMQDGISSERSEISKPVINPTLFSSIHNLHVDLLDLTTVPSFRSNIDGSYDSPPIYILNRLMLI